MTHLAWWPFIVLAGAGVGICTGLFGVGCSSVATPVLALLGVPGLIAVASPLPATIPSAAVGAIPYLRSGEARNRAAAWSVLGGAPGTVAGALLSRLAGGPVLLIVSGLYLLVFGLQIREAVGTSLLVITVLAIPTLVIHWLLGHINWVVAGEFALGQVPGSAAGSRFAHHVQGPVIRRAFGWFLVAFGLFFTIDRIVAH